MKKEKKRSKEVIDIAIFDEQIYFYIVVSNIFKKNEMFSLCLSYFISFHVRTNLLYSI